MFHNYLTEKFETECAERGNPEHWLEDRWFIRMGFAGFNSPTNNRLGYNSKEAAEAACLRYQNKSK